jgi:2,4-dichlorophenol 6-monooxygenase
MFKLATKHFGSKSVLNTQVCIVGSGPVGMVLSRMLSKFGIENRVLEKYPSLQNHPKAHYLSFRSCEILKDLLDDNFLEQ